ncbi:MAG: hypothetical protein NVSMB47_06530 [Polyangiales bacterium]
MRDDAPPGQVSSARASGTRRRFAPFGHAAQATEPHARCIDEWVLHHGIASTEELTDAFERALRALWNRASAPLGEGTLSVVMTSVLNKALQRHPSIRGLSVAPSGVRYDRSVDDAMTPAEARLALREILVELLSLLGEMTAQVLTPALHDSLSRLADERRPRALAGRR